MLNLKKTKTLSAVALAVAAIATPSVAAANNYHSTAYENCKRSDTENQVLGGVLGAVAGGVFGSQVAGNGARTEGSALGAVIGAVAGSQIVDKDCKKRAYYNGNDYRPAKTYRSSGYNSGYTTRPVVTTSHHPIVTTTHRPVVTTVHHPVRQPSYHGSRGYNQGYGYSNRRSQLDREIRETRNRLKDLKRQARYDNSYRLERRINRVGDRLRQLKNERKYVGKDRGYNTGYTREYSRGYSNSRSGGHYHGSNICYSDH